MMNFNYIISIIIPVYGRDDVFATVAVLKRAEYADRVRIVVVDNGNHKERAARLRGLADDHIEVIRLDSNRGGSGGYIAGMKHVMEHHGNSEFIWLLDDDAEPNEETLPGLLRAYEQLLPRGEKVASVGSAIVRKHTPTIIAECGAWYLKNGAKIGLNMDGEHLAAHKDEIVKVEYCSACSCLVPMAALRRCGLWEDVFIHYDDVEWGLRAEHKFGLKNFATTMSVVSHPEVTCSNGRGWMKYFNLRNRLWIDSKYARRTFLKNMYSLFIRVLYSYVRFRNYGGYYLYRLVFWDFVFHRYRTRNEILELFEQHGVVLE